MSIPGKIKAFPRKAPVDSPCPRACGNCLRDGVVSGLCVGCCQKQVGHSEAAGGRLALVSGAHAVGSVQSPPRPPSILSSCTIVLAPRG